MAAIKYGIQEKPFVAVKADAGSYGMAVMMLQDAEEIKNLTKREIEVLKLIAEGLFNKEIAYTLDISEKTVKNHVSNKK